MALAGLVLLGAAAYAAEPITDQDYRNLDELKRTIIRARREMDRFVRDVTADTGSIADSAAMGAFGGDVRVDVTQDVKDVIVRADLPGMSKDKIQVTLTDKKILKIAGERSVSREERQPGIVRQERSMGKFERVLELPAECRSDGIRATYKDGVLEILIPKAQEKKQETVSIKVQ
jgi:HSP20 family protein